MAAWALVYINFGLSEYLQGAFGVILRLAAYIHDCGGSSRLLLWSLNVYARDDNEEGHIVIGK
jgi:hypothetical protein